MGLPGVYTNSRARILLSTINLPCSGANIYRNTIVFNTLRQRLHSHEDLVLLPPLPTSGIDICSKLCISITGTSNHRCLCISASSCLLQNHTLQIMVTNLAPNTIETFPPNALEFMHPSYTWYAPWTYKPVSLLLWPINFVNRNSNYLD